MAKNTHKHSTIRKHKRKHNHNRSSHVKRMRGGDNNNNNISSLLGNNRPTNTTASSNQNTSSNNTTTTPSTLPTQPATETQNNGGVIGGIKNWFSTKKANYDLSVFNLKNKFRNMLGLSLSGGSRHTLRKHKKKCEKSRKHKRHASRTSRSGVKRTH